MILHRSRCNIVLYPDLSTATCLNLIARKLLLSRGGSRAALWGGLNPELDFGGHNCRFDMKSFLALLLATGNSAAWETIAPLDPPLLLSTRLSYHGTQYMRHEKEEDGLE